MSILAPIMYFINYYNFIVTLGFPGGLEVKASASNAGDLGSIPGTGRSPGEGNGNPLQYSSETSICLSKGYSKLYLLEIQKYK